MGNTLKSNAFAGYGLMTLGLFCFGVNGPVAKLALLNGLSSSQLSAMRIEGAFILLLLIALIKARPDLKVKKNEILPLIGYGFFGVAMTQFLYFVAIKRIEVGVALIIEFTAPIMVALYLRFILKRQISARVWFSLFLAILGLSLITQVWTGFTLDSFGVLSAFGAAVALAIYYIGGEFLVPKRSALALTTLAMGVGAIFWVVAQPWTTIPWKILSNSVVMPHNLGSIPLGIIIVWIIFMGTVLPFWLYFMAFKYVDSKKASVFGLLEPVLASLVALILLGETLVYIQVIGGIMVLIGVLFAETARN